MKTFKFSELDEKAQNTAACEYINGWYETHDSDDDRITVREAKILLRDSDEQYTEHGLLIYEP